MAQKADTGPGPILHCLLTQESLVMKPVLEAWRHETLPLPPVLPADDTCVPLLQEVPTPPPGGPLAPFDKMVVCAPLSVAIYPNTSANATSSYNVTGARADEGSLQ